MPFRITGLDPTPFTALFGLPDTELAARGVTRTIADAKPGYPCRITLADAEPGERVLLLNYTHQPAATPYRASHAIYVRERSGAAYDAVDRVPEALRSRLLSLRAFDASGMMLAADVVTGNAAAGRFDDYLADAAIAYVHAHYAKRGCYAALVTRAPASR